LASIIRKIILLLLLAVMSLPSVSVSYGNTATKEQHLKAAFLVQFVKYTVWPDSSSKNITIGVLGPGAFTQAFSKYQGKRLHGKTLEIVRIDDVVDAETCCQLVFLTSTESRKSRRILRHLVKKPILTVSENNSFTRNGGIIRILKKGPKLKFVISVRNAKKSGLEFSSRMLKVAHAVEK